MSRRARIRLACVAVATILALGTTAAYGISACRLADEIGDERSFCGTCQMAIDQRQAPARAELRERWGITAAGGIASLVLGVNAIRLKHRLTE
jgi:hypothetical protein